MPIANIIDKRTNNKDVIVEAIFEPSAHDNCCEGATQFSPDGLMDMGYKEVAKTTIA